MRRREGEEGARVGVEDLLAFRERETLPKRPLSSEAARASKSSSPKSAAIAPVESSSTAALLARARTTLGES